MRKSTGIFVKINYKLDIESKTKIKEKKMNYKEYNSSRYMICGGTYNKNGGTFIFQANDLEEANKIINDNPFATTSHYSYEIFSKSSLKLCV